MSHWLLTGLELIDCHLTPFIESESPEDADQRACSVSWFHLVYKPSWNAGVSHSPLRSATHIQLDQHIQHVVDSVGFPWCTKQPGVV